MTDTTKQQIMNRLVVWPNRRRNKFTFRIKQTTPPRPSVVCRQRKQKRIKKKKNYKRISRRRCFRVPFFSSACILFGRSVNYLLFVACICMQITPLVSSERQKKNKIKKKFSHTHIHKRGGKHVKWKGESNARIMKIIWLYCCWH